MAKTFENSLKHFQVQIIFNLSEHPRPEWLMGLSQLAHSLVNGDIVDSEMIYNEEVAVGCGLYDD